MRICCLLFVLSQFVYPSFGQEVDFIVYPGDTGNDSIVSARDLLPIGVAYNRETFPREPAMVNWAPQEAVGLALNTLPVTGINIAHVDANGDGLVDSLDSEIIALNYDSLVQMPLPPAYQPVEPVPEQVYCPFIRLEFNQDFATVEDTVILDIYLDGLPFSGVPEPLGVLGASFTLLYDPLNIKDSLTRVIPDTLLGDLMFVHASFVEAGVARTLPQGRIDFAAAGYGMNTIVQPRHLGKLQIIVEDMILRSNIEVPFLVEVDPSSVLILNREEFFFQVDCEHVSDMVILTDTESEPQSPQRPWRIHPNPSEGTLYLSGEGTVEKLRIFNAIGQLLYEKAYPAEGEAISPDNLPAGTYWVQIVGEEQVQVLPWEVTRGR